MNIKVTGMKFHGHEVPVPNGLSELLRDTWTKEPPKLDDTHHRHVERRNGRWVTVLTKKVKKEAM